MKKITICGGGNLGHVCAGYLASQSDIEVSLLTTKPNEWSHRIEVIDPKGKVYNGVLAKISDKAQEVIPEAEIVLLCLPGFAIREVLLSIAPYLALETWVGSVVSSTGFFFECFNILSKSQPLFGFQRVPFISRIIRYGYKVELKGYKESLSVAVEQIVGKESIRSTLEMLFHTPVKLLDNHYEVSLSNSNPLLHTSRLYSMWKDWEPGMVYHHKPGFYSEWTLDASELYIAMDVEFQILLKSLGVREGGIPSVLEYYESDDAVSLTKKIRSISAFQGIESPMKHTGNGWIPDFESRYFREDFPYGLKFIYNLLQELHISSTYIDRVYKWGMSNC
ncbi:MAG: NAD/NADP octopine/nopaline dehydrogenase family protein [Aeriscardovia sp.]|nr:NAD/NADP octopine/nopaline dehydrogenase family protein [Aeriscardovia sp.]